MTIGRKLPNKPHEIELFKSAQIVGITIFRLENNLTSQLLDKSALLRNAEL